MQLIDTLSAMSLEAMIAGAAIGIVVVIAVSIALKLIGPLNAATRSVVWTSTLGALPLIPLLYFAS
jgi:hypothetical protein